VSLNSGENVVLQIPAVTVLLLAIELGVEGWWELLGGGRGLGREDRRGRVGCSRAIRDGSLLGFCAGDGGRGLLVASTFRRHVWDGIRDSNIRDCHLLPPTISVLE